VILRVVKAGDHTFQDEIPLKLRDRPEHVKEQAGRRRMATAPSKMSWISERAPTPSGGPKESAHLHTTPQFPASR